MNKKEEEDRIKRQRLKDLLQEEEYRLRLELQQKQEVQNHCYLDNLREKLRVIKEGKKMQRDTMENNHKMTRGCFEPHNGIVATEAREQYGNDLKEQIRVKEERVAKLKKEDERYIVEMREIEAKQLEKDKIDIQRRKNMQLQYTNDLRNQLSDINIKKEEEIQKNKAASNVFNVNSKTNEYLNFGVDNTSKAVLMKKQQNRDDYKKALDEQLLSNLKIRDNKKREDANEVQNTFQIGDIDSGDSTPEDSMPTLDQLIVEKQHDKDDKSNAEHEEHLANQQMYSDYQHEEEQKKKTLLDRNKQYQADLLAQIKEKKERKDLY